MLSIIRSFIEIHLQLHLKSALCFEPTKSDYLLIHVGIGMKMDEIHIGIKQAL